MYFQFRNHSLWAALIILSVIAGPVLLLADNDTPPENKPGFEFKIVTSLEATPVKNQARTGTCWSFATSSFLESELLRMGKGLHDLSEMYIVRHIYPQKARRYVRLHGNATFGSGSLSGDLMRAAAEFGLMPEEAYSGRFAGNAKHNHQEMDRVLKAMLDAIVKNPGKGLSPAWPAAIDGVLDAYLGEVPEKFEYRGKTYTPQSFAASLGIKLADYISLTSYAHHPYYQEFSLEIPDNWAGNRYFNLPLDEFMSVIDEALANGYSVGWDGDVSEKSFRHRKGIAILPEKSWEERSDSERESLCEQPEPELTVTAEVRQSQFDSYASTDDHLMHITGIATDQNGTRYYITKNSYGSSNNPHQGYVYMSEAYTRAKTVSIIVHRDVIPRAIAKRLATR